MFVRNDCKVRYLVDRVLHVVTIVLLLLSNFVSVAPNVTKHSRGKETLVKCAGPKPLESLKAKSSLRY